MSDQTQPQIKHIHHQLETMWAHIHQNSVAVADTAMLAEAIKADLVGVSGNNGLRSEFRDYRTESTSRENRMITMLERIEKNSNGARERLESRIVNMEKRQTSFNRWLIGVFFTCVGLIITIISYVPHLMDV